MGNVLSAMFFFFLNQWALGQFSLAEKNPHSYSVKAT